jgi:hypothetical protein
VFGTANPDDKEARPVLRNAVVVRIEYTCLGFVAEFPQGLTKADEYSTVLPLSKVRNILQKNGSWSQMSRNQYKAFPQVCTAITLRTDTDRNQAPDL